MDRDHRVQPGDLEHAHDRGIGRDDGDAVRVPGGRGDRTHAAGVEEGAAAQVDDDARAPRCSREGLLERPRGGQVELAGHAHDGEVAERLHLDRKRPLLSHDRRV